MARSLLLLLLLVPDFASAQYRLTGSVVKPDDAPVRAMLVQLRKDSTSAVIASTLTDSTGNFSFNLQQSGSYLLTLQSLFYRDTALTVNISQKNVSTSLSPILVQPLSRTLKSVTVSTKAEALEFKDDHISFTPSADRSIGSRPVTDILSRIPGITIDAKNSITAKGQENIQLLVNGQNIRISAGDYLSQLNADEVERIEVYDNAMRFSYIKAAVVINVILKTKQPKKLWNAAINASTLTKINPSLDASFSFRKQRFYSRISYDAANFRSDGFFIRQSDNYNFHQEFNNRTQHRMASARLGWDYYIDSSATITVAGNYSRHSDGLRALISVETPTERFKNALRSAPLENEFGASATYQKNLKQRGHYLFEIGLTRFGLTNQRNLPGLQLSEQRTMDNQSIGLKAEWQKNISKWKILNGIYSQVTQVRDHIDTISVSHVLKNSFGNKAATTYHEVTWQQKTCNLSFGANVDFIDIKLKKSNTTTFSYQELFFNPSFRINTIKGKRRMGFSYNRKYILPSTHVLFGPYSQYEYGRIMPGNYNLTPAVQNLMKISFSTVKKATFLLEAYYDYTKNIVMMLNQVNGELITHQPQNLQARKSLGGVFSITYSPLPYYGFTFNIDGRRTTYELQHQTYVFNAVTWFGSAALINRFTINKQLSFALNTSLHNWQSSLYRNMDPFLSLALQGAYKISPKMTMSFSLNDLTKASRFSYKGMIKAGFSEAGMSANNMRNAFLSIRYQLINSSLERNTTTLKSFMSE